ncbi:hypothetical protein B0H63DRAFT_461176 [Podospora didyma]|uniref:DNA mismatch repair protein S5 domain-containing protein n=1 Tax=Podospora didyma TaxID=330526 RepID=A0AAE0U8J8_9PEZI|nr:hypothetical protein B0H63DRAFT_461176 [Podospora didyma]
MPISCLPETVTRQLGSTLAIATPVALVKELLDNAIDSGATSVDVLISSNTVNRIELRDNGQGIPSEDYASLGQPGHTSKIRTFDDLSTVGGSSLGFRGAALASVRSLAEVSVTTRVSSEPVASVLAITGEGGAVWQAFKSAPIGTTITVTDLFSRYPVRLKSALSDAPKNLLKMKVLLQSYVLAKPQIKMQFRVLKGLVLPWSYAPTPNSDIKETVLQLFGTDLASQCTMDMFDSKKGLIIEAVLPRPGADPLKISKGAFVSVDSRPISSTRGTGKKLVSIFRARLGMSNSVSGPGDSLKDPFIRLNVRCHPGSYDVNVEPFKNDVLFSNEQRLLQCFESFLSSVYALPENPKRKTASESPVEGNKANLRVLSSNQDTETSSSSRANSGSKLGVLRANNTEMNLPSQPNQSWRVDMSSRLDDFDDEDDNGQNAQLPFTTADNYASGHMPNIGDSGIPGNPMEGLNPWSIAKLAAPRRPPQPGAHQAMPRSAHNPQQSQNIIPGDDSDGESTLTVPARELHHRQQHPGIGNGQSFNRQAWKVPSGPYRKPLPPTKAFTSFGHFMSTGHRGRRNHGNNRARSPPSSSHQFRRIPRDYSSGEHLHLDQRPHPNGSVQARLPFNQGGTRRANLKINEEPSQQLLRRQDSDMMSDATSSMHAHVLERVRHLAGDMNTNKENETVPIQAPPFRNPSAFPESLHQGDPDTSEAAQRIEVISMQRELVSQPAVRDMDSRQYLMRRQRSITKDPRKKLRRMKTDLLPLEKIPQGLETKSLVLVMKAGSCDMASWLECASRFDKCMGIGEPEDRFEDLSKTLSDVLKIRLGSLLAHVGTGV